MRFHNFLRSKQSLPHYLSPLKEHLHSYFGLNVFPKFSCLCRSAMSQTMPTRFGGLAHMLLESQGPHPIAARSFPGPRFLPVLCTVSYNFRLDCGKDAWKFSDGLIHCDLKGFFLGGFSFLYKPCKVMDIGRNRGLPIHGEKEI